MTAKPDDTLICSLRKIALGLAGAVAILYAPQDARAADESLDIVCTMYDVTGKNTEAIVKTNSIDFAQMKSCDRHSGKCYATAPFTLDGTSKIVLSPGGGQLFSFTSIFDRSSNTLHEVAKMGSDRKVEYSGHCERRAFTPLTQIAK